MKPVRLLAGAVLALTSVWALAQDDPESLLPPGFEKPAAKGNPAPAPPPPARTGDSPESGGGDGSRPVVQDVPAYSGGGSAGGGSGASSGGGSRSIAAPSIALPANLPSIEELENLTPEELDDLLGLRPKFDMPAGARKSMSRTGLIDENEGGLPAVALVGQDASLVRAALAGNKGNLVSRWGHIVLRRALASRLEAPAGMNPADFAAQRASLLVRMGEGEAARALVQDIDSGNYTPDLTQAALDAYTFTADFTGLCPVVNIQGGARDDAQWKAAQAICAAFRGEGSQALAQIGKLKVAGIDRHLAQKYAGAAGKARQAVKIEWDGVGDMTPWRYGLTIGVGLLPPQSLMNGAGVRYDYMAAAAPMLGLTTRAAAADRAAGAGILSSAAMVDLYSQIYADPDSANDWASRASLLRDAYVASGPQARVAAMRKLWDGAADPERRYSRQVLTAYAAARLPASNDLAGDAADIVASMLTAGLDANAMQWASLADNGSLAWAMLVLAAPNRSTPVDAGALNTFYGNDKSEGSRKSGFLLAGLAGLGRVSPDAADNFAGKIGADLHRESRWTRMIEQSAQVNNQVLVAYLAGLGMQGDSWDKMTPRYLYHIVSALRQVGMEGEARMIAAEAVARG